MSLEVPYPDLNFVPLDILSASEMNQIVANYMYIANQVFDKIYPIGSIYMSATMSTPQEVAAAFGGTWVAWGEGKVPVGVDASDSDFSTPEKTGGEKSHVHAYGIRYGEYYGTVASDVMIWNGVNKTWDLAQPSWGHTGKHTDFQSESTSGMNGKDVSAPTTESSSLQPYITCYMFKRTA